MLEKIVRLLPAEKGSAHCSFLLKLLKAAIVLNVASVPLRADLIRRIGLQLEDASVVDLLLPSADDAAWYDVDLVMRIMEHYLLQSQTPPLSPQVHQSSLTHFDIFQIADLADDFRTDCVTVFQCTGFDLQAGA